MQELNTQMWSSRNFLANVKPENDKYVTASLAFGGNLSTQKVDDEVSKVENKLKIDFVAWIPNNIKNHLSSQYPLRMHL